MAFAEKIQQLTDDFIDLVGNAPLQSTAFMIDLVNELELHVSPEAIKEAIDGLVEDIVFYPDDLNWMVRTLLEKRYGLEPIGYKDEYQIAPSERVFELAFPANGSRHAKFRLCVIGEKTTYYC